MLKNVTDDVIRAAAKDAGNRSMHVAGRTSWNQDDYDVAAREFERISTEGNILIGIGGSSLQSTRAKLAGKS